MAEEFLIQQTSIAPLVIRLHGVEYARAFGVNYVYLIWALAYESLFVVLVPVTLAEFLFPNRASERWLNRGGLIALATFFAFGALGAWFSWTQIIGRHVEHLAAGSVDNEKQNAEAFFCHCEAPEEPESDQRIGEKSAAEGLPYPLRRR